MTGHSGLTEAPEALCEMLLCRQLATPMMGLTSLLLRTARLWSYLLQAVLALLQTLAIKLQLQLHALFETY